MTAPTSEGLVRVIRRWDLVGIAINSIIGAGIFGLPATVFAKVGVWSLASFVVCAIGVMAIIFCFAEVASRFSGTGGPYLYARVAFGPVVGFEVGWTMWIARITAFAANCNLLVAYLAFFVPSLHAGPGRAITIGVVVLGLMLVNLVGVRNAAVVSNALSVAKLLPLLLFVVVGFFFLQPSRLAPGPLPSPGDFAVSVLLLVYAFSGFEMVVIPGGETRDPGRDVPFALISALGSVAVFYFLIQCVAIGTLPGLAASARPLADAGRLFMGPLGASVIAGGAVVSILGNLHSIMLVGARLPFAMAERRELPRGLAATHRRYHTPHVAIVVHAAIILVVTLSGTFVYAATISVIARLLSYAVTCASLPVLRRQAGAPAAAYRAPAGVAVAAFALVIVAWLLTHVTLGEARDSGIAILLGLVLYGLARRRAGAAGGGAPAIR